jgi:hypothetical protein
LPGPLAADEARRDELDPELLALPDPPHRARTLTLVVLLLASAAALAMALALRSDFAYAFRASIPADVGDLRTVGDAALAAEENRYVRAEGLVGVAGGIRYERPFVEDTFRTVPVSGRRDVWVDVRVPAGQENGRWEPPRSFAGRLVRLGAAGPRHRGLAAAVAGAGGASEGAWVLIDGEEPGSARWSVVLVALFLGFAGWNIVMAARILRRVK